MADNPMAPVESKAVDLTAVEWFTEGTESGHIDLLAAGPIRLGVLSKTGLAYSQRRAVADLIVSAPRLRAAIARLERLERKTREEWAVGEAGPSDAEWTAAWTEARAALAKAEGRHDG